VWWGPSRSTHSFDVCERVGFCLLPGELKVPPVVTHTKYGTLYEEPCCVHIKVRQPLYPRPETQVWDTVARPNGTVHILGALSYMK
jgi:hypothetical protein